MEKSWRSQKNHLHLNLQSRDWAHPVCVFAGKETGRLGVCTGVRVSVCVGESVLASLSWRVAQLGCNEC